MTAWVVEKKGPFFRERSFLNLRKPQARRRLVERTEIDEDAWLSEAPLLVPRNGVDSVVDYGNMATPVPLTAHVSGAALFDTGAISGTTTISGSARRSGGCMACRRLEVVFVYRVGEMEMARGAVARLH